jgi:hypothetical protein
VITSPMCPVCNLVEESVEHIIWSCPSAAYVWSFGSRRIQKSICGNKMFANLFENMIGRYDQQELEIFLVVGRRIWMGCNEVVHRGASIDPKQLFLSAVSGLEDFHKSITLPEERSNAIVQSPTSTWLPPPGNMVKINWDAALNQKISCVGLGLLAPDE